VEVERVMAARSRGSQLTVLEDTSLERLYASQLSKALVLAPPWMLLPPVAAAGALFHGLWPQALPAAGIGLLGAGLAALTWRLSHHHGLLGRVHAAASVLASAGWRLPATAQGPFAPGLAYALLVGGPALALSWNIRAVIRPARHGDGDHLEAAFAVASQDAGMGRAALRVKERSPKVIEAVIALPAGEKTADDAIKKAPYLESGLKFPPGSLQIAPDLDRADQALVRISDPRAIRRPQPWPGPSKPGGSMADPLHPGVYQDCEPVSYAATGHHLQVMGMTGSGKSVGAAWSLLAEIITRTDAAVFAIDITKGEQTLGPLRPALHRFVTEKDDARALLAGLQAAIKPRTDYLAARGLQKWEKGCGLKYVVVWLEEAPDVLDALGDKGLERWLAALKAARSAGIEYVPSLQRADWSQMPTLARGQLAKLCMGVADSHDAGFGLSELQADRNCRPELWQNRQPGMAYLDAPGIPDDRIAMPWRAWYWGDDDAKIRAHAAAYPADGRPLDAITAAALGGGAVAPEPEEDEDVIAEYLTDTDEGELDDVNVDDAEEIEVPDSEFGRWQFAESTGEKMDPAEARRLLRDTIAEWAEDGREHFVMADLVDLRQRTGLSRPWLYKALDEMAADDLIERDETTGGKWLIRPL
jgi:hypothetical protein